MVSIGSTEVLIVELLAPLVLIVVLFFVVRGAMRGGVRDAMGTDSSGAERGSVASASEMLDQRYAGGELTREEYLAIKNDISRDNNA